LRGSWCVAQKERKDELDKFLARTDNKNEWRTVHDDYNDEDIVLSKEEVRVSSLLHHSQIVKGLPRWAKGMRS
jgi:ribosome biogenesis protein ERB1